MDVATTQFPGNADGASPHQGCDGWQQSPDKPPVAVVAQCRIMNAGAVGSPVRRSLRLSLLPPPQLPVTENLVESSDDESESINDVALHLSRDETPEVDALPPDEPSTVLAKKIIRAHDNPSPPPRDHAHPGIGAVPEKDDQFPQPGVSVPPSPFRPINLVERHSQFSDLLFDPPHSPRSPALGVKPEDTTLSRGSILPSITTPVPMKTTPSDDLKSANAIPPSGQAAVDDFTSRPPQRVCEHASLVEDAVIDPISQTVAELHGQLTTIAGPLDSQALGAAPMQAADSSIIHIAPSTSDDCPQGPRSEPRQGGQSLPLSSNAKILSSPPPSEKNVMASPSTETIVPGDRDCGREEALSIDDDNELSSKVGQESTYREISTEVDVGLHRGLASRSPYSNVHCWQKQPTSSIEETILPTESIHTEQWPATPPRTPALSIKHPDFSRTSVQRPINVPSAMRQKGFQKLNSPAKFSLELDDLFRTPAQRVPIETALVRVPSSLRRVGQLSTEPDHSRPGRFVTIGAPVFTRPALDDPSRSPAKRIPITETAASPTRKVEDQNILVQSSLRARSSSVEPRPLGVIPTRSRSAEPCAVVSNPRYHGRMEDAIFPMVPAASRAGTKLPFPLVSGQKSSNDLPPPISEDHENAENGGTEFDLMLKVSKCNPISRLRQPSMSSRIPRIGNKPYARPQPEKGKTPVSTKTSNNARVPRPSPFQPACKNNGVGNSDAKVFSTQSMTGQRFVGSLKRKRGTEGIAPSDSHPVIVRQAVPGIISEKYSSRPSKFLSEVQAPPELSPLKVHQPLKFRKVVDGMLAARYAKANLQTETTDSTPSPPSPLSELSSSSNEGSSDEKLPNTHLRTCPESEGSCTERTNVGPPVMEPSPSHRDTDGNDPSDRPRRTSRTRKPAQQQYIIDVFNSNTSTRPPPARRKPRSRTEGDHFMGMSAMALKALTTSNTTRNQQTVAVLATEVIRKEGLRPESPPVKARTILQKQRDERDVRRKEREHRKAQMSEEGLGSKEIKGRAKLDDRVSLAELADHDENDYAMPQRHCRGPGDEEDYETPERPGQIVEPLRFERADAIAKPVKQVKWHRGLSTAVYLDDIHARPKSLPKNTAVRGCLASGAKNLPLDPLGNLVDISDRPSPELVTEQIVVKRYLYDDDVDPEAVVPAKMTRSRSKKSKS